MSEARPLLHRVSKAIEDHWKQRGGLYNAVRTLTRYQIVNIWERSVMREYVSPQDLDLIESFSRDYENLGGNSYIHILVKQVEALPVKEPYKIKLPKEAKIIRETE